MRLAASEGHPASSDLPGRFFQQFFPDPLLARRLFENGVSFVRVPHQSGARDKHRNTFRSQEHIKAEFDYAVGAGRGPDRSRPVGPHVAGSDGCGKPTPCLTHLPPL
jgi:hypothetical protein